MSDKIKADYRPGRKPVLEDFGESKHGFLRFPNGSRISIGDLIDLQNRVFTILPHETADTWLKTKSLFIADEWEAMSNHKRRLLGMGLLLLSNKGRIPLTCINPMQSGTKLYQIKPH